MQGIIRAGQCFGACHQPVGRVRPKAKRPRQSDHIDTTIRLTLDGTETFDLSIINNVLRVSWPDDERPVMSEWSTDRATLIGALTHQFTLVQALENRSIRVSRNSQGSNQFASLFE